ncbi:methyltransferase domain-containing protein [Candidatus Kaiserbacteria bacterium]|nr:methyltransferase domain-containing protein [Candidatus Kaiserbacteria bacterium]
MESPTGYVAMWDAFAKRKAGAYLTDKYALTNIVGLVGCAREHEILRLLELKKADVLLDLGCASGHQVFASAPFVKRAVGIDVAQDFIDTAKRFAVEHGVKNAEFLSTDGGAIPFPDATFTKLICSEVIEHLIDPLPLLAEIKRVLTPGGTAVFTVPNWNSRGTLYKRLLHGFQEPPFTPITQFSLTSLESHGDAHVRQYSLRTFRELVESAGLTADYVGGAGYLDGPHIGRIIEITNRLGFFRWFTFSFEKFCARVPFFKALSRHVVLKAHKATLQP